MVIPFNNLVFLPLSVDNLASLDICLIAETFYDLTVASNSLARQTFLDVEINTSSAKSFDDVIT